MLRIPVIKSDIEIPDWAKSIAQDKDGEIRVFKQSVDELNPFYAEWGVVLTISIEELRKYKGWK